MIPPIIHRIWLGGAMPDAYDHGDSFMQRHPRWEHRLWTDADLEAGTWETQEILDRADELAPSDDEIRFRVDVLRIELLHRYGGIYVDCDAVSLRPLDPLLPRRAFVAESPNIAGVPTNAVMGCEPGHPFLAEMLGGLPERVEQFRGRKVVEAVGARYLDCLLDDHDDVDVLPWWLFAGRSIHDRWSGRPRDLRNQREGFVEHLYGNSRKISPVGVMLRRAKRLALRR